MEERVKVNARVKATREGKPLSLSQHVELLKKSEPEVFKPYDAYVVAQALLENGALNNDNVKLARRRSICRAPARQPKFTPGLHDYIAETRGLASTGCSMCSKRATSPRRFCGTFTAKTVPRATVVQAGAQWNRLVNSVGVLGEWANGLAQFADAADDELQRRRATEAATSHQALTPAHPISQTTRRQGTSPRPALSPLAGVFSWREQWLIADGRR